MQRHLALAATCLVSLALAAPVHANLVVPGALAGVEGNLNNSFPFNIGDFGQATQRYQQVYAAAEFGATPLLITGMAFRPDMFVGAAFGPTILSSVSISLSTTAAAVDALSTTFANNIGADVTLVRSGPLTLSSADTGAGPRDFDIVITFTTPFSYNPALGNLLLDVLNFNNDVTTSFDAHDAADGISRIFTVGTGVNSPTANQVDSIGLVTQFITTSVPEPATLALLGFGLAGLAAVRRRGG